MPFEMPKLPERNNDDEVRRVAANREAEQAKMMADITEMKARAKPELLNWPKPPGWPPGPPLPVGFKEVIPQKT